MSVGNLVRHERTADGSLVVRQTLQGLVGRMTARNRHTETNWGGPSGRESW
jgi:hypothetical protein